MRFSLKTLLMLLVVATFHSAVWAASFTATLDRDTMVLGDQATLSLKFEGVQPQNAPSLPSIAGLRIQYVGPSSSFSFINGQTTSSITYNYVISAQRAGEFTIPAMRADVGNQQLASEPLKLIVTQANAPSAAAVNSGSEVAFMRLTFPKPKVYAGECEVAHLELYLRDDVENFGSFQLTSSPTDGFSAGNLDEEKNQRHREQVGNRIYTVIPLALPLTAVQTGQLTLGPFTASLVVVLPGQNQDQGGDPFFRQFFNQNVQKRLTLASQPLTIDSLPLPTANQPTNFTGAVGDFTMTSTAGPTTVTVGDPITVNVKISGHGDISSLKLPKQPAWRDFQTYPPTTKVHPTDDYGFQGTKTFEEIVSPENAEVKALPELSFSYFNPDDGQYHTLTEPSVPLTVHAAAATPMPTLASAQKPAAEQKSPPDILPIKDKLGTLAVSSQPLVARPAFIALQGVPVLAFFAALIWRKRTDSLANNPRLRRQRAVAQLVHNGLNDLKRFAAENNSDEFFALLFRLLQEQLGERLDCPASAITENVIEEHAVLRTAPAETLDSLRDLFQLCNQARYAPVRGTSELNSVAAKLEKTIGELQEVRV
jgi:hypothetical protein